LKKLILVFVLLSNFKILTAQKEKSALETFVDSTNWKTYSGNILVAKQGAVMYRGSFGFTGIDKKELINQSSRFRIASITKTFIAVLVLQMVDEGKLKLSDTFGRYLPWYSGEAGKKTTIENLLSFSSGISNCEGDSGMKVYQNEINSREFIERNCSGGLQFKPGTEFNYENGSFIILGEILQTLNGKNLKELLQTKIFEPAGMKNSGFLSYGEKEIPFVASYLIDDSTRTEIPEPAFYLSNYGASGAMWSTIEDMFQFDQALFGGRLITDASMKLLLTAHPELYNVSLSLWVYEQEIAGRRYTILNRQGSIQGSNTLWLHVLEADVSIILLSNTNGMNTNLLGNSLLDAALKEAH
jgi:teichoic acid D-alanine hydrolase